MICRLWQTCEQTEVNQGYLLICAYSTHQGAPPHLGDGDSLSDFTTGNGNVHCLTREDCQFLLDIDLLHTDENKTVDVKFDCLAWLYYVFIWKLFIIYYLNIAVCIHVSMWNQGTPTILRVCFQDTFDLQTSNTVYINTGTCPLTANVPLVVLYKWWTLISIF